MEECPRCGNRDRRYFYLGSKGLYCRRCIAFRRVLISEELETHDYEVIDQSANLELTYPLTRYQKAASKRLGKAIETSDVLLHCVCGAGKTEIVTATMSKYLKAQKHVAYAIARKEVVIELGQRFQRLFPKAKVVTVYGGHSDDLYGDIIVCTTHQLYRYPKTFDLLILDEVDAFPFKGDEVLHAIAKTACIGRIIYSTATIDDYLENLVAKKLVQVVTLAIRPHLKPMVIPKLVILPKILLIIYLIRYLPKSKRQVMIFVESRLIAKRLAMLFKPFISCTYVYSDLKTRSDNIALFKAGKVKVIFATTVLERGITIKGVSVVVLYLHDDIFDEASLVQMLGRVGRDFNDPYGDALILANKRYQAIEKSIETLRKANDEALSLLRSDN